MFEFRVTKYNPEYRKKSGAYTRDEWISVCEIGRSFNGEILTRAEYERVENAYVTAALSFLGEACVPALAIVGLEIESSTKLAFENGHTLSLEETAAVIRRLLRGEFWCRLEASDAFVHIGYDYYMYIGVPSLCDAAAERTKQLGLFVERFRSPYNERGSNVKS